MEKPSEEEEEEEDWKARSSDFRHAIVSQSRYDEGSARASDGSSPCNRERIS
jgi:hypothetical protein